MSTYDDYIDASTPTSASELIRRYLKESGRAGPQTLVSSGFPPVEATPTPFMPMVTPTPTPIMTPTPTPTPTPFEWEMLPTPTPLPRPTPTPTQSVEPKPAWQYLESAGVGAQQTAPLAAEQPYAAPVSTIAPPVSAEPSVDISEQRKYRDIMQGLLQMPSRIASAAKSFLQQRAAEQPGLVRPKMYVKEPLTSADWSLGTDAIEDRSTLSQKLKDKLGISTLHSRWVSDAYKQYVLPYITEAASANEARTFDDGRFVTLEWRSTPDGPVKRIVFDKQNVSEKLMRQGELERLRKREEQEKEFAQYATTEDIMKLAGYDAMTEQLYRTGRYDRARRMALERDKFVNAIVATRKKEQQQEVVQKMIDTVSKLLNIQKTGAEIGSIIASTKKTESEAGKIGAEAKTEEQKGPREASLLEAQAKRTKAETERELADAERLRALANQITTETLLSSLPKESKTSKEDIDVIMKTLDLEDKINERRSVEDLQTLFMFMVSNRLGAKDAQHLQTMAKQDPRKYIQAVKEVANDFREKNLSMDAQSLIDKIMNTAFTLPARD